MRGGCWSVTTRRCVALESTARSTQNTLLCTTTSYSISSRPVNNYIFARSFWNTQREKYDNDIGPPACVQDCHNSKTETNTRWCTEKFRQWFCSYKHTQTTKQRATFRGAIPTNSSIGIRHQNQTHQGQPMQLWCLHWRSTWEFNFPTR